MTILSGEDFEMLIQDVTQERLDSEKVRSLLTQEQLQQVYKTIEFKQFKTARKDKKKKPTFRMPNLANATPEGLVDMLGKVREEIKELQKLEGIYKETLQARMDLSDPDSVTQDSGSLF